MPAHRGTAVRTGDGWRMQAEKWFVTSGDVARLLHRHGERRGRATPSSRPCSWSTATPTGSSLSMTRSSPTTTRTAIPLSGSTAVAVAPCCAIGGDRQRREGQQLLVRRGTDPYRYPFVGAMWRLLDETIELVARPGAVRVPHLRLPGVTLPAGRLGADGAERGCWSTTRRSWQMIRPSTASSSTLTPA